MEKLRAAVIGVGHLGSHHAHKYHSLPDIELAAVVDTNGDLAAQVANQLHTDAHIDYRRILSQVDMVSIAAPSELHSAIARDCLNAGVHVLVEKPMTRTVAEARELIGLAKYHNLVLQVGHLERFNPAWRAAENQLHTPHFIESHRLAPFNPRGTSVDVVLDLMIHDIDIVLAAVSSPLVNIQPVGLSVITNEVDIANARLEFANGCVANLTASRVSNKRMRKVRFFQTDAYISVDFDARRIAVHRKEPASEDGSPTITLDEKCFQDQDALLDEIAAFVQAVRTGAEPAVSGEEGCRALEVALEISTAINSSRTNTTESTKRTRNI
jgi:predicted dehydrogenase